MNHPHYFSDAHLNAYFDGELSSEENAELLLALRKDPVLTQRLSRLMQVRGLVRMAYDDVIPTESLPQPFRRRYPQLKVAFAAMLLLSVGVFSGWLAHRSTVGESGLLAFAEQAQHHSGTHNQKNLRVMLHLSRGDPNLMNILLSETETLLKTYHGNTDTALQVELVANGKGLDLLRSDTSPHAQRIAALQSNYQNLVFFACQKTIERLEQDSHRSVQLLPGTQRVSSALNQAIKRQSEGWAYIRI